MSFKVFNYKCPDGHINEHFVKGSPKTVDCKNCGRPATRQLAMPRSVLEPFSGDFAGATIKWAEQHERAAKQKRD